ncbi:MAG TPA: superoxide dismutase [Allosphingosinicella sp.]|nr:superoxide dismutase [Allosphingosinicella sp.]
MPFTLPDLPFARDSLGGFMSAETLDFHHGKHHQAYVDKLNGAVAGTPLEGLPLARLIGRARDEGDSDLANVAGQHWNHNFFWQCLAPPQGQRPEGRLAEMIEQEFGGLEPMLAALKEEAVGHFASGWAWLALNRGKLAISSLHDGDAPPAHEGMTPLLTIDVWEHAYYIDYRHERAAFVEAVLGHLVDWEFVARNLDGEGVARADQEG